MLFDTRNTAVQPLCRATCRLFTDQGGRVLTDETSILMICWIAPNQSWKMKIPETAVRNSILLSIQKSQRILLWRSIFWRIEKSKKAVTSRIHINLDFKHFWNFFVFRSSYFGETSILKWVREVQYCFHFKNEWWIDDGQFVGSVSKDTPFGYH